MAEGKKIDLETVKKIAALAHLKLKPEEEKKYSNQLESILVYMEKLNELDTDDIPITYHPVELGNIWRSDEPTDQGIKADEVFDNAPLSGSGFFKVPKIISGEE